MKVLEIIYYDVDQLLFNPRKTKEYMHSTEVIQEAIQQYNKYRKNIVKAELKHLDSEKIQIYFEGSFCQTCGYFDYFDDLQILLEDDFHINTKIVNIESIQEGDIVEYRIMNLPSQDS